MRRAPLVLLLLALLPARVPAQSPARIIGADPFSLLPASARLALSLQNSRDTPGTRAILADYLEGRRPDQSLVIRGEDPEGWAYLAVQGTEGVLEAVQEDGEWSVALAAPAGRDTQKWRLEPLATGRYRVSLKAGGLALWASGTLRPVPVVREPTGVAAEGWRVLLHPRDATLGSVGDAAGLERQLAANVETWTRDPRVVRDLAVYLEAQDSEMSAGERLLLQERTYALAPDERNWALTLLAWLISQGAWERGDTITLALALANASMYADGDPEVRERIRQDVLAHYRLYREISRWQEEWAIRYRLRDLGLLAKVLWSYRANQLQQNGHTLTLVEYETFVDRIDVLSAMHELVRSRGVAEGGTLRELVRSLDRLFQASYKYAHFMGMIRQWYTPDAPLPPEATDDELYAWLTRPDVAALLPDWVAEVLEDYRSGRYYVEVLGRRRDPQARMWVNYQWQLYGETGYFRGDCGTEAEVSMALWKAAGIAAMAVYHTGKDIGHAYPVYYDPFVKRFVGLQDLGYMRDKFGGSAEVTLHPMPLRIHDHLPVSSPRPVTTVGPYTHFVERGMDYTLWVSLILDRASAGGAVFTAQSAPQSWTDTDGDGLADADETILGTLSTAADTDGDGYADAWEVERGFDPRSRATPTRAEVGKVLVGHVVRVVSAPTGRALEPALSATGGEGGGSRYRIVRAREPLFHYLVSVDSGLALTSDGRGGLTVAPLEDRPTQKWKLLYRDAGAFVIQSRADATVIAATAERGLVTRAPRGTPDERWVIR